MLPLFAGLIMFSIGLVVGRSARSAPPPLIIQRSANSQLSLQDPETAGGQRHLESNAGAHAASQFEELVYICGARTKKGTPCSRRLHQPVRCWQHKGSPAMLPPEKLVVKE